MYGVQLITGPALFPWNTTVPLKKIFFSFVFPKSWSWVQTRSDYGTGSWHRWRVSLFTDSTGSILFPQNINSLFLHYNTVVTKHTVRPFLGNIDAHTALRNGFSQSEVEPERFVTLWQHRVHKWGQQIGVKPRPRRRRRRTAAEKPALFLFLEDIFFFSPHILSDKIHLHHDDVERAECAAAARRHTPLGVR